MNDEQSRAGTATVILGLGSNVGDRANYLERALGYLSARVTLGRISSIYETEPVGLRDQPWFLNLVAIGYTGLEPRALLDFIREGEFALGRRRGERYGPRTIDIDVLAYEDLVISEPDLEIPHPRMHGRAFVLEPLAEIAPEWRHPVQGKTTRELLERVGGEVVRSYSVPPRPARR